MGGLNLQNRTTTKPARRGLGMGPADLGDFMQEAVGMMME
jgi:hypothetical protein